MTESYSAHERRISRKEELELLLNISDSLTYNTISKQDRTEFGVVKTPVLEKNLPEFLERLEREGTIIGVKIVSLNRKTLYQKSVREKDPNLTISVPIVFQQDDERRPAFLIIKSW